MILKSSKEIKQKIVELLTPAEIDNLIAEVGGYIEPGEEAEVRQILLQDGPKTRNWYRVAKETVDNVTFRAFTLRSYEDLSVAVETQSDGTVLTFEFSID